MKVFLGPYEDDDERREEVQIHNYDTWSMDHTLALIIEPMLRQLKDTQHGAPYVEPEDVPEELRPSEKDEYGNDDTHFKRWDWVLDEMIFAFASLNGDYEEKYSIDIEGLRKIEQRIDRGFELFGKYYRGLWD
jgi:hypothetical protein